MVSQTSDDSVRVRWLQDCGILKDPHVCITRTYWVYRLLGPASNVSREPFVPRRAGDLPPDIHRVADGTPLDALFKRLVQIGYAEVYVGPYLEHERLER